MSQTERINYNQYLLSGKWFSKRRQAFKIHGEYCSTCRSTHNLHVHHKTYKRLGNEKVKYDLIPLCEGCHEKLHEYVKIKGIDLYHGSEIWIERQKNPSEKRKKQLLNRENQTIKNSTRQNLKNISSPRRGRRHSTTPEMEIESNIRRMEFKKTGNSINVSKFMEMYGIDEQTALSLL